MNQSVSYNTTDLEKNPITITVTDELNNGKPEYVTINNTFLIFNPVKASSAGIH
jgi:hypothetical protein